MSIHIEGRRTKQEHTPATKRSDEARRIMALHAQMREEIQHLRSVKTELVEALRQALVVLRAYGVNPYTNLDNDASMQAVIVAALAKAGIEMDG